MKSKKLQYWAFVAEIIGSIAIIISLIYVGFEIRQNSKEVRAANRQSIASRVENFTLTASINPLIWAPYDGNYESLSPERQSQLGLFNAAFFRNTEEAYLMYLEGLLDEEYWQSRSAYFLVRMNAPHVKIYWEESGTFYTDKFREWVEKETVN